MSDKKLKYEFSQAEVRFLKAALERVQVSGLNNAQNLVHMVGVLNTPLNESELEKEVLDAKYEKPVKK
jgi:hypothetical protein